MSKPKRASSQYRLIVALLLYGLLVFVAGPALAQEEAAQEEAAQEEAAPDKTAPFDDVITVTALKGEALTLLETPIAVSAFSGEELEDRGAHSLVDFLQEAPGTSLTEFSAGVLRIEIRGLSSELGDPLIGYYIDETPYSLLLVTWFPDIGTFDLERVEVLRGPQGTLYGAGATGGVIRLLTRNPQLRSLSVNGDIGFSSFDGGESTTFGNVALNVPLGTKAAFRLTGSIDDQGGYIDYPALGSEDANDSKHTVFRGKFLVELSDSASITFSGTRNDVDADNQNTSAHGWVSNKFLAEPGEATNDFYSGVFQWVGSNFSLLSSTNAVDTKIANTVEFAGTPLITGFDTSSFVQEIRLNSTTGGDWRWTGGGYYADIDQLFAQDATAFLGPLGLALETDTSESLALFGELSRSFANGRAQATLGARYWEEDKSTFDPINPAAAQERSFDDVSPRLNLSFFPSPDNTFYLNVAKGFRSGQNQFPTSLVFADLFGIQLPPGAEEETLWAYELGYKSRLAGGKVLLEVAAYQNQWDDLIIEAPIILGAVNAFLNAGSAEMPGIEFALKARPNDTVSFGFSGHWNDAKLTETVEILALDPTTGMSVPAVVFMDGDPIPLVPSTTFNADVELQHYFGGLRGFAALRGAYTDERFRTLFGLRDFSDKVTRLDLRLGVDAERWGVHLFADNLNNEDGITIPSLVTDKGIPYHPRAIGIDFIFRP